MNIFGSRRTGVALCVAGSRRNGKDRRGPTRRSAGMGFLRNSEGLGPRRCPNLPFSGVDRDLFEGGRLPGSRMRSGRHSIYTMQYK